MDAAKSWGLGDWGTIKVARQGRLVGTLPVALKDGGHWCIYCSMRYNQKYI
jgi:hypothetical protein